MTAVVTKYFDLAHVLRYSVFCVLLVANVVFVGCQQSARSALSNTTIQHTSPSAERFLVDLDIGLGADFTWGATNSIYVAYANSPIERYTGDGPHYGEVDLATRSVQPLTNFVPPHQISPDYCAFWNLTRKSLNQVLYYGGCVGPDYTAGYPEHWLEVGVANTSTDIPPITLISGKQEFLIVAWSETTQELFVVELIHGVSLTPVIYEIETNPNSAITPIRSELNALAGAAIADADFSADGDFIVFIANDEFEKSTVRQSGPRSGTASGDSIWLYEIETGNYEKFELSLNSITDVRWSPVRDVIAVNSLNGVLVCEFSSGNWILVDSEPAYGITWSPDGQHLAVINPSRYDSVGFAIYDTDEILSD